MENRHRLLLGVGVEVFRSSASEEAGCVTLLQKAKKRLGFQPQSLGADKGYFHRGFIEELFRREISPHIASLPKGSSKAHMRVRMRQRGEPYRLSQRSRKKIEELFGEAKDLHGLRRFRRRGLQRVRQETWLIGLVLNLKRLAKLTTPASVQA